MGWTEWPDQELAHAHHLAQGALRIDPANQLAPILLARLPINATPDGAPCEPTTDLSDQLLNTSSENRSSAEPAF